MTTPTQGEHAQTALAHELFAAAQLAPGEGIEDAVSRITEALTAAQEVPKCDFLAHGCDTPSYCQSVQRCTARDKTRAAPAQPAAPQGVAYAELPEPDSYLFQHDETGLTQFVDAQQVEWGFQQNNPRLRRIGGAYTADKMRDFADRTHALRASNGQAPAGATEELALTRQTNLAVAQRLQAKINTLEAELAASRKAESQVQSYADDLDRRAQYDADNLADACGGYGGERI